MQNQTADVIWQSGQVPVSTRFDDPYFSLEDGLAESRHVFLQGNALPARFKDGFHIAELGFGTGLNFLATVQAWQNWGGQGVLHFTSFEAFPIDASDMKRALSAFQDEGLMTEDLAAVWQPTGGTFDLACDVVLNVIIGDAEQTLPQWQGRADAWFLDGFSPAKNPTLWSKDLMVEVAGHTNLAGSFATYTAAGFVRRNLAAAGFHVERTSGFGRKRHMTSGVLPH